MKKENLYPVWGMMFVLCAGLGFVPEPQGGVQWLFTALSVLFFVPPALIVYGAVREKAAEDLRLVRNLAAASLGLTLLLLIGSIVTAVHSEALGQFFHALLVIVSAPMLSSGYWALSLFLWACLLMACIRGLRK